MKKSFFLVGLNGITFWPEWGLTNLSFRPRPSGVWPERQNFKGLKGTVLNVRKPPRTMTAGAQMIAIQDTQKVWQLS